MNKVKKFLIGAAASAMLVTNVVMPAGAATPNWELNAPSAIMFGCGGSDFAHTLNTVSQNPDGTFTGAGDYDADSSYTWDISGTVDGDNITFTLVYDGTNAGYTLNGAGTVAIDGSISGSVDNNCQTFTMPAGSADAIVTPTPTDTPTPTPVNPFDVPEECNQDIAYNLIEGTSGSEVLQGTNGSDLILARGGSDVVNGRGGADCIVGGAGSDHIVAGDGADVVLGGTESDSINGNDGADMLWGEGGSDAIRGNDGADNLFGGGGSDSLQGNAGTDTADGGAGSDACSAETEDASCEA